MKLFNLLLPFPDVLLSTFAWANIQPTFLRCEYRENPLGIDDLHPHFNWNVTSGLRKLQQSADSILVVSSPEKLTCEEGNLWNTGKISSPWKMAGLYFMWSR